jgi:ubiquinone/menaquinone biosynthesis C-methylase UbiE
MSNPGNEMPDQQGYFIDAENAAEMARLTKQAQTLSEEIGLFPSALDLTGVHDILDVACGPGGWALEVARRFPEKQITGLDISRIMINYARYTSQSLDITNAQFLLGDATQALPFPDNSFDLVNTRLITGFMRTTTWQPLLQECLRILRPGGFFCMCESDCVGSTNSSAMARYGTLTSQFMRSKGQYFNSEGEMSGVAAVLPRLFVKVGYEHVQKEALVVDVSADQPAHESAHEDFKIFLKLLQPALVHSRLIEQQKVDRLYTQAMEEFSDDDFCLVTFLQRIWGQKHVV